MKAHGDTFDILIPGVPHDRRLPLLCRVARTTFAEIERAEGLARGSVSAYVGGRTYLYPRLRRAIVKQLGDRLGLADEALTSYLFEETPRRQAPAGHGHGHERGVVPASDDGRDAQERSPRRRR